MGAEPGWILGVFFLLGLFLGFLLGLSLKVHHEVNHVYHYWAEDNPDPDATVAEEDTGSWRTDTR